MPRGYKYRNSFKIKESISIRIKLFIPLVAVFMNLSEPIAGDEAVSTSEVAYKPKTPA